MMESYPPQPITPTKSEPRNNNSTCTLIQTPDPNVGEGQKVYNPPYHVVDLESGYVASNSETDGDTLSSSCRSYSIQRSSLHSNPSHQSTANITLVLSTPLSSTHSTYHQGHSFVPSQITPKFMSTRFYKPTSPTQQDYDDEKDFVALGLTTTTTTTSHMMTAQDTLDAVIGHVISIEEQQYQDKEDPLSCSPFSRPYHSASSSTRRQVSHENVDSADDSDHDYEDDEKEDEDEEEHYMEDYDEELGFLSTPPPQHIVFRKTQVDDQHWNHHYATCASPICLFTNEMDPITPSHCHEIRNIDLDVSSTSQDESYTFDEPIEPYTHRHSISTHVHKHGIEEEEMVFINPPPLDRIIDVTIDTDIPIFVHGHPTTDRYEEEISSLYSSSKSYYPSDSVQHENSVSTESTTTSDTKQIIPIPARSDPTNRSGTNTAINIDIDSIVHHAQDTTFETQDSNDVRDLTFDSNPSNHHNDVATFFLHLYLLLFNNDPRSQTTTTYEFPTSLWNFQRKRKNMEKVYIALIVFSILVLATLGLVILIQKYT